MVKLVFAVLPAGLEEAYISYEVTTVTSLPHFSSSRCSVRRRFRDFVSLSNLLPKLLHGRCGQGAWQARTLPAHALCMQRFGSSALAPAQGAVLLVADDDSSA